MSKEQAVATRVYFPQDLLDFLDGDSKKRDRTRNQHIKEILYDYKEKLEKESK